MKITCTNCGHTQNVDAAKILGAKGGKKSRRTITPDQQAKMQAARFGMPRKDKEGREDHGSLPKTAPKNTKSAP
jgi:hypothetical protein